MRAAMVGQDGNQPADPRRGASGVLAVEPGAFRTRAYARFGGDPVEEAGRDGRPGR
ncbi:hypothetical protein AB0J82_17825 [Asanoa sp. NPDC049518]|uniref:hypothetical protein n=1 Tax=unclassified Asanoa TaxID=2685164 RepID=UPI00342C732D